MQTAPLSVVRPRTVRPDFIEDWPSPPKGLLSPVRRRVKELMLTAIDNGWFGLRPLRTHIVMVGFPRSGSTLLQLQIETCVSDIRKFGKEVSALPAAQSSVRNNTYMFTKDNQDLFYLDEIRGYYADRRAEVRFILTLRDPRAVLTSIDRSMTDRPTDYYMPPSKWLVYYEHVRYAQQFDDVLGVEYQDVISRPAEVQRRLTEFVGWHVHLPFDRFHTAVASDFDQRALNGLRPLDATRLDAWRQEKHRDRIRQVLREIPEFPEYLIDLGYEHDTSWVQDYL
jgi:hypothetical protein